MGIDEKVVHSRAALIQQYPADLKKKSNSLPLLNFIIARRKILFLSGSR